MPLEHLLAALERNATAQTARFLAEARAEAERITAADAAAIDRRRGETLGAREREHRAALEAALSTARRAARREVLEARERLLERVFAVARAKLAEALGQSAYRAALPGRVAAALACIGEADATLSCPASLAAGLREAVSGNGRVTVRVDPAVGSGFRLRTTDGAVEVDDTLETRLEARRPELAREALRQLGVEP